MKKRCVNCKFGTTDHLVSQKDVDMLIKESKEKKHGTKTEDYLMDKNVRVYCTKSRHYLYQPWRCNLYIEKK